jgi:excisionase family DNA binding protein
LTVIEPVRSPIGNALLRTVCQFEGRSAVSVVRPLPRGEFEVRFLTVAEVAVIMRVSKMTVYRLVHAGDLIAMRVGRSYRVPERAVQDYLRHSYLGATSTA